MEIPIYNLKGSYVDPFAQNPGTIFLGKSCSIFRQNYVLFHAMVATLARATLESSNLQTCIPFYPGLKENYVWNISHIVHRYECINKQIFI